MSLLHELLSLEAKHDTDEYVVVDTMVKGSKRYRFSGTEDECWAWVEKHDEPNVSFHVEPNDDDATIDFDE